MKSKNKIFLTLFLAVFLFSFASAGIGDNISAYYKLDEGAGSSGTIIDSLGINNGTNSGSTNTTGKINNAYDFDGNDYIDDVYNINYTNFSISGWFNKDQNAPTGQSRYIYSSRSSSSENPIIAVGIEGDGYLYFRLRSNTGSGITTLLSPTTLNNDIWYFFTATFDLSTGEQKLYINNNSATNVTYTGGDFSDANTPTIGSDKGSNDFFDGTIDEIGIWNRVLDEDEISLLYSSGDGLSYPFTELLIYEYNGTNSTLTNSNESSSIIYPNGLIKLGINGVSLDLNYTTGTNSYSTKFIASNEKEMNIFYYNGTFRETITWDYEIFGEENNFNASTYETASESFILNITANSSLTAVTLDYNGTDYSMTYSDGLWSKTMDIPEGVSNRTLRYKFTYAGDTIYSDYFYQNVSALNFSICGGSLTNDFLNISFQDEAGLSFINASIPTSTFEYYLGSGDVTKSYTFSNTSVNYNYQFCVSPTDRVVNVNPYIQYKQGTDYPQRIYEPVTQQYNETVTDKSLYLLSSVDGIYVTFQVINSADQTLSGVDVTAVREIDGEDVTVGTGTTSASGSVTFWLNPDFEHTFTFEKSGYTTYSYADTPTQTSYTITLSGGSQIPVGYTRGVSYDLYPTNSSLTNDTIYDFGISLDSDYWDISEYGFNLRLNNGTIITGSSTSTLLDLITISYNTTDQSRIYMDYYWKINDTYTNGTVSWRVYNTDKTQWSIKTFFDDFNRFMDEGIFGIDDFGRYLITFLILFLGVGILGYKYGINDPMFLTGAIFFLVLFLDVGIGLIPDIRVLNGNTVPYLLTFVSGLIFVVSVISEVGRR